MKVLISPTSTLMFTEEFVESFINDPSFYEDLKFGMTYRDNPSIIERAIAFPIEDALTSGDGTIIEIPDGASYIIKNDLLGGEHVETYITLTLPELLYGLDDDKLELAQKVDYLLFRK